MKDRSTNHVKGSLMRCLAKSRMGQVGCLGTWEGTHYRPLRNFPVKSGDQELSPLRYGVISYYHSTRRAGPSLLL